MKYYIRINGYEDVECATRDLVIFIARKLKEAHPTDEVVAYKDGEVLFVAQSKSNLGGEQPYEQF